MFLDDADYGPGLKIWRIEQLKPVKQDASGKLHAGDAYLVLYSVQSTGGSLKHEIHFWLGNECSQDEGAAAAMLAVQLDKALAERGADALITRHTQRHESDAFLSLFPSGLTYLPGGTASGLSAPAAADGPVLYCIAGSRRVRISQVPLARESLNSTDGFILDDLGADAVVQWLGGAVPAVLKFHMLSLAEQLRSDKHGGSGYVALVERGDTTSDAARLFYASVGVEDPAAFDAPARARALEDTPPRAWAVAYTFTDGGPTMGLPVLDGAGLDGDAEDMTSEKVASHSIEPVPGPLTTRVLRADAMLLLYAHSTLWVWLGRRVPEELRESAMSIADELCVEAGIPQSVSVEVARQGLAGPTFSQYFADRREVAAAALAEQKAAAAAAEDPEAGAAAAVRRAEDARAMAAGNAEAEPMPDEGSGTKKVWRIEDSEAVEAPASAAGSFSSAGCYLVLYTFPGDAPRYLLYIWQGRDSSAGERGAAAAQAEEIDGALAGGKATQVRVVQGKEPGHFVAMWAGRMVVTGGGGASSFATVAQADAGAEGATAEGARLYRVRGDRRVPPSAAEVPAEAGSLNSGDAFVLVTASKAILWTGVACSPAEAEAATLARSVLLEGAGERATEEVAEGSEPDDFWEALGGKGDYSHVPEVALRTPPRLFVLSDAVTGGSGVGSEEIVRFAQSDLLATDVALLDTEAEVFVWVGAESSVNEQQSAMKLAEEYLTASQRSVDSVPVSVVKQGCEPPVFTAHFQCWDAHAAPRTVAGYEERIAQLRSDSVGSAHPGNSGVTPAAGADPPTTDTATENRDTATENGVSREAQKDGPARTSTSSFDVKAVGKAGNLTAATKVGGDDFKPAVPDPSGTKGTSEARKYVPGKDFIELAQLRTMKGSDGIDPEQKEAYLSDEAFLELFKMDREKFNGLPLWRRQTKKKELDLF